MAETITITVNDDSTFTITEVEGPDAAPGTEPMTSTVNSVEEVCAAITAALGDEAGEAGQAEWDKQATARDAAPTDPSM